MITEDYVSFETAKLLKQKGFDCANKVWYSKYTSQFGGKKYISIKFDNHDKFNENYKFICYAPTLQMAMKWLREVHKFIPIVLTGGDSQNLFYYWFRIDTVIEGKLKDAIYREDEKEYSSYEQAAEAAIKYCLEHLI